MPRSWIPRCWRPKTYSSENLFVRKPIDNLLIAWSAPNPRDHFYMTVFGKTYAEKMRGEELENNLGDKEFNQEKVG